MTVGLILAGGEGRRWGGPKAWAKLPDGRSFLEACAGVLDEGGCVRVLATLPPGSLDPKIPGLRPFSLTEQGLQMFDSFRIGLTILIQSEDWERLVVLPVDHPLVSASTIERLAAARDSAVVPTFGGKHGHPFCVSRRVVESVVCGELSGPTVRDVLRGVGITDIEVNDPGVVANCNTPAALADALSAIRY